MSVLTDAEQAKLRADFLSALGNRSIAEVVPAIGLSASVIYKISRDAYIPGRYVVARVRSWIAAQQAGQGAA
jgi:hypothetical protein